MNKRKIALLLIATLLITLLAGCTDTRITSVPTPTAASNELGPNTHDNQEVNNVTNTPTSAVSATPASATSPTSQPPAEPTTAPTVPATTAPTATPEPTAEPTTEPTATPEPTATEAPTPTATTAPTETPTPTATNTPKPTAKPTATPKPTAKPTPKPTAKPTPAPTASPKPTNSPKPTATQGPTPTPKCHVKDLAGSITILKNECHCGGLDHNEFWYMGEDGEWYKTIGEIDVILNGVWTHCYPQSYEEWCDYFSRDENVYGRYWNHTSAEVASMRGRRFYEFAAFTFDYGKLWPESQGDFFYPDDHIMGTPWTYEYEGYIYHMPY